MRLYAECLRLKTMAEWTEEISTSLSHGLPLCHVTLMLLNYALAVKTIILLVFRNYCLKKLNISESLPHH